VLPNETQTVIKPPSRLRTIFNYVRLVLLLVCIVGIMLSYFFGVTALLWLLLLPIVVVIELAVAFFDGFTRKRLPRRSRR